MIPYYEELNDEEKNAVTKVIRTLLKQTFVLERKYDKKSGRLVYNKEFRTIDLHQEFLIEYFIYFFNINIYSQYHFFPKCPKKNRPRMDKNKRG